MSLSGPYSPISPRQRAGASAGLDCPDVVDCAGTAGVVEAINAIDWEPSEASTRVIVRAVRFMFLEFKSAAANPDHVEPRGLPPQSPQVALLPGPRR